MSTIVETRPSLTVTTTTGSGRTSTSPAVRTTKEKIAAAYQTGSLSAAVDPQNSDEVRLDNLIKKYDKISAIAVAIGVVGAISLLVLAATLTPGPLLLLLLAVDLVVTGSVAGSIGGYSSSQRDLYWKRLEKLLWDRVRKEESPAGKI